MFTIAPKGAPNGLEGVPNGHQLGGYRTQCYATISSAEDSWLLLLHASSPHDQTSPAAPIYTLNGAMLALFNTPKWHPLAFEELVCNVLLLTLKFCSKIFQNKQVLN